MTNKSRIYAFDFDGVIAHYDGFKGHDHFGDPISATVDAIRVLKSRGHKILIYSTRSKSSLQEYCSSHDIPVDYYNENLEVNTGSPKPVAYLYIDDRAIRYDGQSSDQLLEEIDAFEVYWKKQKAASSVDRHA